MLEYWNSGLMGSGIMQCWINGPATGGIDDKVNMVNILLTTNISTIPVFPYSISGANSDASKNLYIISGL